MHHLHTVAAGDGRFTDERFTGGQDAGSQGNDVFQANPPTAMPSMSSNVLNEFLNELRGQQ
jgi:hypothetical protein